MKTLTDKQTQTKIQKFQIEKYILDAIDPAAYDVVAETDKEKLQFLVNCFNTEYNTTYNLKHYGSKQKVFENWLQGLPSCFNIDYQNHKIVELGKEWDFLAKDCDDRKEDKFIDLWWARIYMNVNKLCTRHKIEFWSGTAV